LEVSGCVLFRSDILVFAWRYRGKLRINFAITEYISNASPERYRYTKIFGTALYFTSSYYR